MTMSGRNPKQSRGDGAMENDDEYWMQRHENARQAVRRQDDTQLLERALGILHRFGTEQTGWRAIYRRWYYSDEPLRNDAANLVREAGFGMMMPLDTRLVGDDQ